MKNEAFLLFGVGFLQFIRFVSCNSFICKTLIIKRHKVFNSVLRLSAFNGRDAVERKKITNTVYS